MSLTQYQSKRNFERTREPRPRRAARAKESRFVVQKHAASRLHYDFRLEIDGTLKSWAVPKGIPLRKSEKRLAVQVEDHPVSYIDFEGTIPQGEYGGGTVLVWDKGTFHMGNVDPIKAHRDGKLSFSLAGTKLKGDWHLVRLKDATQWLLIRAGDDMKPVSKKADNTSAKSGKSMEALAQQGLAAKPGRAHATSPGKAPKRGAARKRVRGAIASFIPPMLAKPLKAVPQGEWFYELKFDGYRALILKQGDQIQLLSRNEKDLAIRFSEIAEAAKSIRAEEAIIDGELVALDERGHSSFRLLQSYAIGTQSPPLAYYAFDLLELEGKSLRDQPIEVRKATLKELIPPSGMIHYSPSLGGDASLLLKEMRKHRLEGVIGKRVGSRYEPGTRSGTWIKLKITQSQEVVIGGYTDPQGTRPHFGSLLTGVHRAGKLIFSGKVGTGFDDAVLELLKAKMDALSTARCPFVNLPEKHRGRYGQGITPSEMKRCHWVKPSLVCQVTFHEWTRDSKMRHPAFLGLRDDKNARDVVREMP
ncbi:MAG: non-homologous end-joining DNA ligase [Verrucomicrobiales bacterium]|nr:non-homologous end-joining DNA ligase [Verrucomicrobiales bacterium]